MRISDWSSDVCSSDLNAARVEALLDEVEQFMLLRGQHRSFSMMTRRCRAGHRENDSGTKRNLSSDDDIVRHRPGIVRGRADLADQERIGGRSEEHTPELQSLMRNSYAAFCSKKKKQTPMKL